MSFKESNIATEELQAVLACLEIGVLTVDRALRVFFANPAARKLIQCGDGLRLNGDRLYARDPDDTRLLAAAVGNAPIRLSGGVRSAVPAKPNVMITVSRGGEVAPIYRVVVVPLSPNGTGVGAEAALFVDSPHEPDADAEAHFFQVEFQLTPAEAKLAVHLMSGESLTQAADKFGVTHNTVRSQLRAIFEKTQARRQADLVRLLQSHRSLRRLLV